MISNGTVARGQVKKSNGKVTTRLVWQGKRYDVKSNGKVQSRYDLRLNGVKRQSDRTDLIGWTMHCKRDDYTGTGKDRKELRWPCVGLLSEGKDK